MKDCPKSKSSQMSIRAPLVGKEASKHSSTSYIVTALFSAPPSLGRVTSNEYNSTSCSLSCFNVCRVLEGSVLMSQGGANMEERNPLITSYQFYVRRWRYDYYIKELSR